MAYTLKTTGLATKLIACVAVDEDGTTVKDFVTGRTATQHAAVAAPKTGAATWKGVNRNWFKTDYGADTFAMQGVLWSGTLPALPPVNGFTLFVVANQLTDAAAAAPLMMASDAGATGLTMDATNKIQARCSDSIRGIATTSVPVTTKCSFAAHFKNSATGLGFFLGLESGALAADGTYADGNFLGTHNLSSFGGLATVGSKRGQWHLVCAFTDTVLLTLAELQSLHTDWFGTLFDAVTSTTQTSTTPLTLTANATQAAAVLTSTTQTAATPVTIIAGATQSYNVSIRQVSTAPDALGHVFGALAGTPWVSLTGINWYWQDTFGGPVINSGSGASTDASGVLTVTLPSTALANGARGYLSLQVPDANPAATWPRMLLNLPVTVT